MTHVPENFRKKVETIFSEMAGPARAQWLNAATPSRCIGQIAKAIASQSGYANETAANIAINVADWQADAAFLVALHLFPERFSDQEIDEAVRSLLLHVPAHVIAAARLAGHPTDDIFAEPAAQARPVAPIKRRPKARTSRLREPGR